MSFIDWSDSEGMIDLFREFVRDEIRACPADPDRQKFLGRLLAEVTPIGEGSPADALEKLRAVQESIEGEYGSDPAFSHLVDLIQALERLV